MIKLSMKLLLGQSVVLVEHPSLEPQLFMPTLGEKGIVFKNLIFDYNAPIVKRKPKQKESATKTSVELKVRKKSVRYLQKTPVKMSTVSRAQPKQDCCPKGKKLQRNGVTNVPPPIDA